MREIIFLSDGIEQNDYSNFWLGVLLFVGYPILYFLSLMLITGIIWLILKPFN